MNGKGRIGFDAKECQSCKCQQCRRNVGNIRTTLDLGGGGGLRSNLQYITLSSPIMVPHSSSQPSCPPSSPILTIGRKITLFVKSHSVLAVRQSKGVKFLRKLFHGQMVAKFMQHQCCELQNRALASPLLIL